MSADTTRSQPTDADSLLTHLQEDGIERLWVVYHDYSGRAQGKIIPRASMRSAVRGGVVFAKANLDFDHHDHQAAGASYLADSGDFLAIPDPASYAILPQYAQTARVHAFMRDDDGSPWEGCPRTRLVQLVEAVRAEGYSIAAALEPEFYVVTRDERGDLHPVSTTPMFSTAGMAAEEPFLGRVLDLLAGMGVEVPQIGKEYSLGQYELSTTHGDPVHAVDTYYAVREAVRDAAAEFGYEATFMPKPYADWSGNSLHVHLSIWDAEGATDLTPDPADEVSISALGRQFAAGLLDHVDALTGLGSPTVNSYKRLQPGTWAPANTYWGYGNRSGVIRIPGYGKRRHLEYRASDNAAQPEMLLTGLIAAGMDGIRRNLDPGDPFHGDIGHMSAAEIAAANIGYLPRTLGAALDALEADAVIGEALGASALEHALMVRRHELATYEQIVHAWERETYFPIV
ncbi:MAG: glutamine synthetase family protein [Thermomicrobiales bacterium]